MFTAKTYCDYDWADESGHISFGLSWIKAIYPDWSKDKIISETAMIVKEWRDWIERHHHEGTHGYDIFLSRIEAIVNHLNDAHNNTMEVNTTPTHLFEKR